MFEAKENTELTRLKLRFDRAVKLRQNSMIRDKIVPLVMPPLAMAGTAYTSLLCAWDYLSPQAQQMGVTGALTALGAVTAFSLVRTFGVKANSPFIGRKKAISAIDKSLDSLEKPASKIEDHAFGGNSNSEKDDLFELEKLRIWKKWQKPIENQTFKTGFGAYYKDSKPLLGAHTGLALATALSAALLGEGAFDKFEDALHWTPPPPPLQYQAWVTPPANIISAQGYLPDMLQGAIEGHYQLDVHEGSVLSIVTYDRAARVFAGDVEILPETPTGSKGTGNNSQISYSYQITFTDDSDLIDIRIEDFTLNFAITPDDPPKVVITTIAPNADRPNQTDLEYSIEDDFGVTGAEIRPRDRKLLPSAELPTIQLPILNAPGIPSP